MSNVWRQGITRVLGDCHRRAKRVPKECQSVEGEGHKSNQRFSEEFQKSVRSASGKCWKSNDRFLEEFKKSVKRVSGEYRESLRRLP